MKKFQSVNTYFYPAIPTWPCRTYNNNCNFLKNRTNKLISTKDGEIAIQPLWRMELFGRAYGIDIEDYAYNKSWESYYELLWSSGSRVQRERFHKKHHKHGNYSLYFEELAKVAYEIGCERTEIKCLIKSLIIKFKEFRVHGLIPYYEIDKLLVRLEKSGNKDLLRVADRLSRYFYDQL